MQNNSSNILSDLKALSDNSDLIISETDIGNDQVGRWFSMIKETANAIVKGTDFQTSGGTNRSSLLFNKADLPNLVDLIKGKQNTRGPRVSTLLAETQKDHVSHQRTRQSLRKIILGKKSNNQWKISNRKSSAPIPDVDTTPTPKIKDRLLESQFRSTLELSTNKCNYSELDSTSNKSNDLFTPIQNRQNVSSNTDITPLTRSKKKLSAGTTQIVKKGKGIVQITSECSLALDTLTPVHNGTFICASDKVSTKPSRSSDNQSDVYLTPENKTIDLDSDSSNKKAVYTATPITRSKRKSSVQLSLKNTKKSKNELSANRKNSKPEESRTITNSSKQTKLSKPITSVIPPKPLSNPQQNKTPAEKRILREIQKKEDKVNQNAMKIQSLKQKKIEENKKTRELKMEKAMQQRKKIEKEKEERVRSRTQSKQENILQKEISSKKPVLKKVENTASVKNPSRNSKSQQDDRETTKANSSSKEALNKIAVNVLNSTYVHSPIENLLPISNEKAPPKPIRNNKKTTSESESIVHETKPSIQELALSKEVFIKPNHANYMSSPVKSVHYQSSTPTTSNVESNMNLSKTPVSISSLKSSSYAMTPHESSFVSYDISEIKSDDSDDEESVNQKPIPAWATGVQLRKALLNQHYASVNTKELFGNFFGKPDLAAIMGTEKKHYYKRTSSAIWINSPNRSIIS